MARRSLLPGPLLTAAVLCAAAAGWAVGQGVSWGSAGSGEEVSAAAPAGAPEDEGTPFAWLLGLGPPPQAPPVGEPIPVHRVVPRGQVPQPPPRECMPWKFQGVPREFHFTRGIYSGGGGGGGWGWGRRSRAWCTDHPKAEEQFLEVLDRLTGIDAFHWGNAIHLDDPDLRRYPILYMLEVGYMGMTESEVRGLRDYLLAGGFLIIDDFWGTREWFNFEREMARVFPEYPIVDLPMEHPVYRAFYQVDTVLQVPVVKWHGDYSVTWEQDGYHARNFGIFDDRGRLMVAINWNTDLGDAWEWMEQPHYPLRYSTYAYQIGVNYIVYAMSN